MRIDIISQEGSFYKANLHCHTTKSDGRFSPEECKKIYQDQGYSVLAVTDHNRYGDYADQSEADFLMIAGCEVEINQEEREDFSTVKTYHLNLYDKCPWEQKERKEMIAKPDVCYEDIEAVNQYIDEMNRLGFLVSYNHPYWSLQDYRDYGGLKGLFGFEIYNHSCELDGMYGYQSQVYDELLRSGKKVRCLASDDNHNLCERSDPMWDSFGGFTMIKARELRYETVIAALQKGDFYCSTGPLIEALYIQDGSLSVCCSPAVRIYVITKGRRCYRALAQKGKTLTEATFPLTGKEGYIRVDVEDAQGRHAYSNAWFLEEEM